MSELVLQDGADGRLSDRVYETLLESIVSGKLAPGDVVSEVSLAKRLEVSRTPVHDAVRKLADDGLVMQQANRRPVIATFSSEDVFDIFEMRKLLEGEAAARAATQIDREALAALRATADGLLDADRNNSWIEKWVDADEEFHAVIAEATGSKRLLRDINRYRLLHRGFNKLHTNADTLKQAVEEHLNILDALDQRNAAAARDAMTLHIGEWQAYFVNFAERSGKNR